MDLLNQPSMKEDPICRQINGSACRKTALVRLELM